MTGPKTSSMFSAKTETVCIKADSVYRAISLGIIDFVLSSHMTLRHPGLNLLMKLYNKHYAPASATQKYLTAFQELKQLTQKAQANHELETLINQLASVVFQLTLYGLQQHPTLYHEYALPVKKRDYFTYWIDKSAAAVIANLLGWHIVMTIVAAGKPLHAKMTYSPLQTIPTQRMPTIKIQERHDEYSTVVRNSALFHCQLSPETHPYGTAEDIEKLLPHLRQEKQAFRDKYKTIYRRLDTYVKAQELSKDKLSEAYQKSITQQNLHGIQAFSDSIQLTDVHDGHLIRELLCSLTCLIIFKYVREEDLFPEKTHPLSVAMPSL